VSSFDETYGGFGTGPKLPHAAALSFAIDRVTRMRDEPLERVTRATLDAMARGALFDDVEGGFFRYSTARDWSLPQYEKLLDVNAGLLRVYSSAWRAFDDRTYRDRAAAIVRYVHAYLADRHEGGFHGSQRAHDGYYVLRSVDERRIGEPPAVDGAMYTDSTALMASAYIAAGDALRDPSLTEFAIRSLERVLLAVYRPAAGLAHWYDGEAHVRGLLADHVYACDALIDAHLAAGTTVHLEMAEELALHWMRLFSAPAGGFVDAVVDGLGLLREPARPFGLNADAARVLARLSELTGRRDYLASARRALAAFAGAWQRHDLWAAPYVGALAAARAVGAPSL
jgi:uncharacterized protein YyaL (SSP411 family)